MKRDQLGRIPFERRQRRLDLPFLQGPGDPNRIAGIRRTVNRRSKIIHD